MGLWAAAAVRLRRSARHAKMRAPRVGRAASKLIDASIATLARDARHASSVAGSVLVHAERRTSRWGRALAGSLESIVRLVHYRVPGERRTCPACGSARITLLQPMMMRRSAGAPSVGFAAGCHGCGLVFANPFPSRAQLDAFYSPQGEWGQAREREDERQKTTVDAYVRALFEPAREWLDPARPPEGGAVFELGCGNGELLDVFERFGWSTCGLDPGDKRAFTRHRELTEIPAVPSFDVAILHHVLEHVDSPLDILRAIHAALRPGGTVLVSVPRLDTLARHRDYRYCINPRTHVVAYSRDCMATLFAIAGFDSVDASARPEDADDWFAVRRLRMIGRKTPMPAPPPGLPLSAAQKALAQYFLEQEHTPRWRLALPVRARAALADLDRRRRLS